MMVLNQITYFPIFRLPLIAYGGILTLGSAFATVYTGVKQKPIKIHKIFAAITLVAGTVHGLLAILAYF